VSLFLICYFVKKKSLKHQKPKLIIAIIAIVIIAVGRIIIKGRGKEIGELKN
jgi:hypothetical protein